MQTLIKSLFLMFMFISVLRISLMAERRMTDIYWIDVEGGGATLVVTPSGESILIDAGENLDRDASRIHHVVTRVAGVKQVDHVVTTHWHSDHFGGVYKLSQLVPLKRFYANRRIPESLSEYQQSPFPVLKSLYQKAVQENSQILKPGDSLPLKQGRDLPQLVIECIASDRIVASAGMSDSLSNPVCSKKKSGLPDESDNARSLVLRLKYGAFTFLNTGDLTWNMEERLVCPADRIGPVDLFQISHHGLDQSNNPVLIESIRPRVVIINNAPSKGAEPKTMKTLKATHGIETIWQLHRNVQIRPELNAAPQFIANYGDNDDNDEAKYIKASAQPDGAFSVQIGQSGTRRDYLPR